MTRAAVRFHLAQVLALALQVAMGVWVLFLFLVAVIWDPFDRRLGFHARRRAEREVLAAEPYEGEDGEELAEVDGAEDDDTAAPFAGAYAVGAAEDDFAEEADGAAGTGLIGRVPAVLLRWSRMLTRGERAAA